MLILIPESAHEAILSVSSWGVHPGILASCSLPTSAKQRLAARRQRRRAVPKYYAPTQHCLDHAAHKRHIFVRGTWLAMVHSSCFCSSVGLPDD